MANKKLSPVAKKLCRFLKENDAYSSFIKAFKKQEKVRVNWSDSYEWYFKRKINASFDDFCEQIKNKSLLIQFSFIWKDANEGHEYWQDLSRKWKNGI